MRLVIRLGARDGNFEDFRAFSAIRGAKRKCWIKVLRVLQSEDLAHIGLITKESIKISSGSVTIRIYNPLIIGFSQFNVSDDGICRTISVQRIINIHDPNGDDDTPRPGGRRRAVANFREFDRVPHLFIVAAWTWGKSTNGLRTGSNGVCSRTAEATATRRSTLASRSLAMATGGTYVSRTDEVYNCGSKYDPHAPLNTFEKNDQPSLPRIGAEAISAKLSKVMLKDCKVIERVAGKVRGIMISMAPVVCESTNCHFISGKECESVAISGTSVDLGAMPRTRMSIRVGGRSDALASAAFLSSSNMVDNQELVDPFELKDRKLCAEYNFSSCDSSAFKGSKSTCLKFMEWEIGDDEVMDCSKSVETYFLRPEQSITSSSFVLEKAQRRILELKRNFVSDVTPTCID